MTEHLYAIPLTRDQLRILSEANSEAHDAKDNGTLGAILDEFDRAISTGLPPHQYFDVLGWYPGLLQWMHVFTAKSSTADVAFASADQASRDFNGGFTHFLVVPIPSEADNAKDNKA